MRRQEGGSPEAIDPNQLDLRQLEEERRRLQSTLDNMKGHSPYLYIYSPYYDLHNLYKIALYIEHTLLSCVIGKKITIENDFHKKVISKKGRELQEIRIQKTISKEENKEDFKVQIRNQNPSVQNNSTTAATKDKISSDSGEHNI